MNITSIGTSYTPLRSSQSFDSTFAIQLPKQGDVKSIYKVPDNIKQFIREADEQIRGKKDISVYSPQTDIYYIDISDYNNDKKVFALARKWKVSCKRVKRYELEEDKPNAIVSVGKDKNGEDELTKLRRCMPLCNPQ